VRVPAKSSKVKRGIRWEKDSRSDFRFIDIRAAQLQLLCVDGVERNDRVPGERSSLALMGIREGRDTRGGTEKMMAKR
jgi:hypothetical protein